ncbi:MAG: NrtA/SsuA/CpmA family ABC transporter substrate-binding protein [Rhodoferax sp.]
MRLPATAAPAPAPVACARRRQCLGWMLGVACGGARALEYFDSYGLQSASAALDLGVQPLGYPSGVLSSVMQRDRLLLGALQELRQPLRAHPFRRGADMVALLADQRLEAALLGDMPTLLAAAAGEVWIVGLVKQSPTAVVARDNMVVSRLKGRRIGYVEASSAHLTLLQGLAAAGLSEKQVTLVSMGVNDMPQALEGGDIDAFAGWEPATTLALSRNPRNHVVFRGSSSDYFVLQRQFAQRQPQTALALVAGYARAVVWMGASTSNLQQAARWALEDTARFAGSSNGLSSAQVMAITRRELLDIPSAPVLLDDDGPPRLKAEFEFLQRLGKLSTRASWAQVDAALAYDALAQVLGDERRYRVRSFDYA